MLGLGIFWYMKSGGIFIINRSGAMLRMDAGCFAKAILCLLLCLLGLPEILTVLRWALKSDSSLQILEDFIIAL